MPTNSSVVLLYFKTGDFVFVRAAENFVLMRSRHSQAVVLRSAFINVDLLAGTRK